MKAMLSEGAQNMKKQISNADKQNLKIYRHLDA